MPIPGPRINATCGAGEFIPKESAACLEQAGPGHGRRIKRYSIVTIFGYEYFCMNLMIISAWIL